MIEVKFKADLKELEELTKRFPEASLKARESRLTEVSLFLERAVKLLTPEGAGPINLRKTIFGKTVNYGTSVAAEIGTPLSYGEAVEYGTKPHYPPRAPIIFWVSRKLGLGGIELRRAVRAIQWHIYHHGTKGAHMFERAFEDNKDFVMKILERIVDDIIKDVNGT